MHRNFFLGRLKSWLDDWIETGGRRRGSVDEGDHECFRNLYDARRSQFHQPFMNSFFKHTNTMSKKIKFSHQCLFVFLGSVFVKSLQKNVDEINPRLNFISIFCAHFWYKSVLHSFSHITVWLCNFGQFGHCCKSCS